MTPLPACSDASSATHRIRGPAELLQAVPYLLGFHPAASLVLVGLHRDLLVVTARVDLADLCLRGLLADTVAALSRGGSTSIVAAVYDDADPVLRATWRPLHDELDRAADDAGCVLLDLLVVSGERWSSAACEDDGCCPGEGIPLPEGTSSFAAAATVAGVVPLPDRAALESSLDPVPDHELVSDAAIAAAENALHAAAVDGDSPRRRTTLTRELRVAAHGSQTPGWTVGPEEQLARFSAALSIIAVRDELWLAVDAGTLDGRPLWRELARRAPGPYRAAPLLLFGWATWRAGDGALAGIAARQAVESDPEYSAADLLLAAVNHAVDPRTMPRLGPGARAGRVSRRRGRTRDR